MTLLLRCKKRFTQNGSIRNIQTARDPILVRHYVSRLLRIGMTMIDAGIGFDFNDWAYPSGLSLFVVV